MFSCFFSVKRVKSWNLLWFFQLHSILNCGASKIIIAISKSIDDKHKTEDLILIKWLKNEFSGPGSGGKKWSSVHDKRLVELRLKVIELRKQPEYDD